MDARVDPPTYEMNRCPYCQGNMSIIKHIHNAYSEDRYEMFGVMCHTCDREMGHVVKSEPNSIGFCHHIIVPDEYKTREEAVAEWNRRTR